MPHCRAICIYFGPTQTQWHVRPNDLQQTHTHTNIHKFVLFCNVCVTGSWHSAVQRWPAHQREIQQNRNIVQHLTTRCFFQKYPENGFPCPNPNELCLGPSLPHIALKFLMVIPKVGQQPCKQHLSTPGISLTAVHSVHPACAKTMAKQTTARFEHHLQPTWSP